MFQKLVCHKIYPFCRSFGAAMPKRQFVNPSNPFSLYTQNFSNNEMYKGFTGGSEGGNNNKGTSKKSSSSSSGATGGESYLRDFYSLPDLSKLDQVEIITELTNGSEINMTPS